MGPVGLGTKNHCAGEGQQQFSSQLSERVELGRPIEVGGEQVEESPLIEAANRQRVHCSRVRMERNLYQATNTEDIANCCY
jgi:hypothetical protein